MSLHLNCVASSLTSMHYYMYVSFWRVFLLFICQCIYSVDRSTRPSHYIDGSAVGFCMPLWLCCFSVHHSISSCMHRLGLPLIHCVFSSQRQLERDLTVIAAESEKEGEEAMVSGALSISSSIHVIHKKGIFSGLLCRTRCVAYL